MKPFPRLLYIEADEEITDLVDRLRELAEEETVTFVVPERARALQSPMSFKLLRRYADSYGKRVNIISSEPRLQTLSQDAGFTAYESLDAYEGGTPSGAAPSEGNGHVAIEPAVERAPAAVATAVRETPRPSMSAPPRSAGPTPIAPPSPRRRRRTSVSPTCSSCPRASATAGAAPAAHEGRRPERRPVAGAPGLAALGRAR
jgi:hypothetical protein